MIVKYYVHHTTDITFLHSTLAMHVYYCNLRLGYCILELYHHSNINIGTLSHACLCSFNLLKQNKQLSMSIFPVTVLSFDPLRVAGWSGTAIFPPRWRSLNRFTFFLMHKLKFYSLVECSHQIEAALKTHIVEHPLNFVIQYQNRN